MSTQAKVKQGNSEGDSSGRSIGFDDLIRGERSAAESYKQVLEKYGHDPAFSVLKEIAVEHLRTAQYLIDVAKSLNGDVPDKGALWGAWAKLAIGTAKVMGPEVSLKVLREGEEYGWRLYKDALSSNLDYRISYTIRKQLLPQQEKHIRKLEKVLLQISA